MTTPGECGCDECCEQGRPVFLHGGDELAVQLRQLAFAVLLTTREPVEPTTLARLAKSDEGQVATTLDGLARAGRIDRDERERVLGAAGLTLANGPHDLAIDSHPFRTWCAFDALGIPAALGADARVTTACGVCGRRIELDLPDGRPAGRSSARLWLSTGGADMRADFCTPTVLLCSSAHVDAWAERHAGHGRALTLAEASDLGATDWRSVAGTASRIGMTQKQAVDTTELSTRVPAVAYRTGPIGRMVRAGLLALLVLSLVSLLDQGGILTFRRPSVAGEPSVWFLTFVMAVLFVSLVGQLGEMLTRRPATRWQLGAIAVLVGSALVAAVIGQVSAGAVWGFPLADPVWAFDLVMLIETTVALAIAIVLGTPGCEIGMWGELLGRRRPDPTQPPMVACVVGLHLLDDFERRSRASVRVDESHRQ